MKATTRTTTTREAETSANPGIQKIPYLKCRRLNIRVEAFYDKCCVPRVVSLGPYHKGHSNDQWQFIQDLKPYIVKLFVKGNATTLQSLYRRLHDKIKEVRNCYDGHEHVVYLTDSEFTSMMVEDGCFILVCINSDCISDKTTEYSMLEDQLGLKSRLKVFIMQDLLLLENQVPYMVLKELMSFCGGEKHWFREFFGNTTALERTTAHLLQLLHDRVVGEQQKPLRSKLITMPLGRYTFWCTFRNVNDLLTVGITLRPCKTGCADIQFKSYGFSAYLELPPISVFVLLNLVTYEMTSNVPNDQSWFTSYICFLDSLIYNAEDVKELRKARILDNSLGSDEEVAKLFKEISTRFVPGPLVFTDANSKIQRHYDHIRRAKTWATELKHVYFKSPWSAFALVGAIVALFLSSVQAYFAVWPAPGDCDALCKYLKQNHHL